ncbi:MAG: potassium channel family protein [Rhizobiaceae bacterium]
MQIVTGSFLLLVCSALHIVLLVSVIGLLGRMGHRTNSRSLPRYWVFPTAIAFAAVILAHTIQVWLWALSFIAFSVLPDFSDALYFSLVTYTTVGYGDVTVGPDHRLYAAMAAVTGLLNFGLSTAFLVGLFTRLLPREAETK